MDRGYDLSNAAVGDLRDIWDFTLDRWGASQAETYYRGLIEAIAGIASGVNEGRPLHARPGYFRLRQGRHVIFYIYRDGGRVFVSRILHEAMDVDRHL